MTVIRMRVLFSGFLRLCQTGCSNTKAYPARSAIYLHFKEWQLDNNIKAATVSLVQHRFHFSSFGRSESLVIACCQCFLVVVQQISSL